MWVYQSFEQILLICNSEFHASCQAIYLYECMSVRICVCMSVCLSVCLYVCIHKNEWKFGRMRNAVGTRAAGECCHSFF